MRYKAIRLGMFIALLGVGATTWRIYAFIRTIDQYELDYCGPLSDEGFNQIQSFLYQHTHASLTEINQHLLNQFAFMNSATLQRMPNRTVRVLVTIPEPCAQLNDALFLFSSGTRCPTNFLRTPTPKLPKVWVPERIINTTHYDQALAEFVYQAPQELFATYHCEFHAPSYIKLTAHDQSHNIICLSTIESNTFKRCQQLIEEQQSNKKAKKWIGDIRFKNQIILQKEGGGHGTNS